MYRERKVSDDPHDIHHECDCDPSYCTHGECTCSECLMDCYKCGRKTVGDLVGEDDDLIRVYCEECSDKIRHADKHGKPIDAWEARFVE